MSHIIPSGTIARTFLLAGILLAALFLASQSFFPAFAQEEVEYPENSTDPVIAFTATDPEGDSIMWSVGGTDADDFSVTDGVLRFKNSPDFETSTARGGTPNAYTVIVTASDGNGGEETETVNVEVTNVEEPGEITTTVVQPKEDVQFTATLADDDGVIADTQRWQWATSTAMTGPWNDIDDARARGTGASHDFTPTEDDVGSYLRATVTYMDGKGVDDPDTFDVDESLDTAVFTFDRMVLMADYSNMPPVFKNADGDTLTTTSRSVDENSDAGTNVGSPVVATDNGEDGLPELLTYSLTDASSNFTINSSDGQISVNVGATLDRETTASYEVTVTAADPSGETGTIAVTINLTDVDEPPTITAGDSSTEVAENTPSTTQVGSAAYAATDPEDDVASPVRPLTWSLAGGGDNGKFNISSGGVLTFKESPDYETPTDSGRNNVYDITVVVTDSGGNTDTRAVTVTVTPVDEAPSPLVTLSNRQGMVGTQITATLHDPDKPRNIIYSWATSTDAIQEGSSNRFTPRSGSVSGGDTLTVTVTYTDEHGDKTGSASVTVLARPVSNNRPRYEVSGVAVNTATRDIAENATGGTDVGAAITITDEDGPTQLVTHTLSGGGDIFTIDRDDGQISLATEASLDRETTSRYTLRVRGTDPYGGSVEITVTVNVTDIAEGPFITGGETATANYAENGTGGVITLAATDPEDDKDRSKRVSWSVPDDSLLAIGEHDGVLKFKVSPDFEARASETTSVVVTATDSAGGTDTQTVTVTVTDEEELGTITLPNLQPKETIPQVATLTDPDGGVGDAIPLATDGTENNLTAETTTRWQWARSTNKSTWTNIEMATSSSYTPVKDDVGSYLRVTATYQDRRSENAEDLKAAEVESVNKVLPRDYENTPPVFPDQDPSTEGDQLAQKRKVAENSPMGTKVGAPVAATDLNRAGNQEALIYKLYNAGVDADAPGTAEGEGDARIFAIDNTGQITVATTTLDYDDPADTFSGTVNDDDKAADDSVYEVQVKAIDPTMASTTIDVTIRVTNVDEAPRLDDATETANLSATSTPESPTTATTTLISTYTATDDEDDAEATQPPLQWTLQGPDSDMFQVCEGDTGGGACDPVFAGDPDTVHIRFKELPDYEARSNKVYRVTVVVTDSDDMSSSRDVAVTLTNVDEDGEVKLSNVQPEVGTPITATLTDPDGGISNVDWQWQLGTSPDSTADADWTDIRNATSQTYTPVAEDVGGGSNYLRATVEYLDNVRPADDPDTPNIDETQTKDTANDVSNFAVLATVQGNQAPVFPDQDPNTPGVQDTQATRRVQENSPEGAAVGTPITATNEGNLTYRLEGTDEALFTIDTITDGSATPPTTAGQIRVGKGTKLDYETKRSYSVTVRATDTARASDTIAVTINVIPVNEAPMISTKGLVVSGDRSVSYAEDRTDSVATYTAVGSDANGATWSLSGTDASAFSIAGGVLSFNNSPDFENPADAGADNMYNVTVRAVGATISASRDVTVTVTNVDEAGTASITPATQPRVGVELTATLTDVDGTPTAVSWQWARSTSNTGGWSDIANATNAAYTPVDDDVDNYLRATASYTDPQGPGKSESAVTSATVVGVTATPDDGSVSVSPAQPVVGTAVTATLSDPDGAPVAGTLSWQWAWSTGSSPTGTWTDISGATSASYTPTAGDVGRYLRATATYEDSVDGVNQTASGISANAVQAATQPVHRYDRNANGSIEREEVIAAINDFLFGDPPPDNGPPTTRAEVIEVINLFLFGYRR